MNRFRDSSGRAWDVVINVGKVKKLRNSLGIDLNKIDQEEGQEVFSDIVKFVDMLYVLVEEQCIAQGVDDIQFGEGLVGDSIDEAAKAVGDALTDFFPLHRRRILRATLDKGEAIKAAVAEKAVTLIASLTVADLIKPLPISSPSLTNLPE